MTDVAALSFSIDSSQAREARRNLDEMRSASRDAAAQAAEMARGFERSMESTRGFRGEITQFGTAAREAGNSLDALIERVNRLAAASSGLSGPLKELQQAYGLLEGTGRMFGTTAQGIESFSRQARQIGLDSQETVNALRRIQSALEGVTAEGRTARTVLESYGVTMAGLGRNDADRVLRDFVARTRTFRDDAGTRGDIAAVMGPMSPEAFAAMASPAYRTIEQQARGEREREQQRIGAAQRDASIRALGELQNRRDEQADLEREWGGWTRQGFFQSDADRLRELRARQTEGVARGERPYSQTFAGRFQNAADRAEVYPFLRNPMAWALTRTTAPFGRMIDDYFESDAYQTNSMALDRLYEQEAEQDGSPFNVVARGSSLIRRARLAFGDTSVVPPIPSDNRPVIPRVLPLQQMTQQMLAMGRMEPADLARRDALMRAASVFEMSTEGWDRMTADQIWARTDRDGFGAMDSERRRAVEGFITVGNSLQIERMDRGLQPSRNARGAWSGAIADGGTSADADRAAAAVMARAQAERELTKVMDERVRAAQVQQRVDLEMAEYDQQRASSTERMTQLLREQTRVVDASTDAFRRARASGEGVIDAQAAATVASVRERARMNPRGPSADAMLADRFSQIISGATQERAAADMALDENERQIGALAQGGVAGLVQANAELARQRDLRQVLQAMRAAELAGHTDALGKLREITDQYDDQRRKAEQLGTALREAYAQQTSLARDFGSVDDVLRMTMGGGDMYGVRRERFIRQGAQSLFAQDDSRLSRLSGDLRARRAYELLTPDQRQTLARDFESRDRAAGADEAAMIAARLEIAQLRTEPDPANRGRLRILEAEIMARAQGRNPDHVALAGAEAAGLFAAEREAGSRGLLFGAQRSAAAAAASYGWFSGGQMPAAISQRWSSYTLSESTGAMDPNVRAQIIAEADRLGVPRALALQVAALESSGQQFGANGQVVTSSAGARGVFQLMPGTARQLGVNPDDTGQNIRGGVTYLSQLLQRFGGDPIAAYAGFHSGPNNPAVQRFAATGDLSALGPQGQVAVGRLMARGVATYPEAPFPQGGTMATDLAEMRARLYGGAGFEIAAQSQQLRLDGRLRPDEQAGWELAEASRRASEALAQFAQQTLQTGVTLAETEQRIGAGSTYARGLLQAESRGEALAANDRALAARLTEGDPRRAQLLQAAEGRVSNERALYNGRLREQFADESKRLDWEVEDAEFERDNWWRSSWSLRREAAMRQTRRSLRDRYTDRDTGQMAITEEQLEGMVSRSGQVAQFSELNRITQATREAMLGMGQAASAALEQIILRGGTARQVMASLAATMASIAFRSAAGTLFSRGFEALGGAIFGGGAAGGLTAYGGVSPTGAIAPGAPYVPGISTGLAFGGVIESGDIVPFNGGGVVDRPTYFPLAGGKTGLMGEAGAEAVLPLRRGADGRLGVVAAGGGSGGGVNQTINVTVNGSSSGGGGADPAMVRQISDAVQRAAQTAAEQAIANQMRLGGMLNPTF